MEARIFIREDYLYLPVQTAGENKRLAIYCEDGSAKEKIFEFCIPVECPKQEGAAIDYYARFPVKKFTDKTLILKGDMPEAFFEACVNADKAWCAAEQMTAAACTAFCAEKDCAGVLRHPSIHFTAETGWINDPNGLVYKDGIYHLYFQYNPFDIKWENMSWGHAVSRDLLHWEQMDAVMFPDEHGTMFSGSGLVNERGLAGLPQEALLFFYTAAGGTNEWSRGRVFTQRMAYSLDGGATLRKQDCVLDTVCPDNRDPKVFWHEQSRAYVMVLWLKEHAFGIFRSGDLLHWEQSDVLTLEEAFECPDLIELCDDKGERHWMFWCADGYYFWGSFNGYRFVTDGVRHKAYMNQTPYAAQTYAGVSGRTVQIPWLRLPNAGRPYTGAMGIPRELEAVWQENELRLSQRYVREYEEQKKLVCKESRRSALCGNGCGTLRTVYECKKAAAAELVTRWKPGAKVCRWRINGTEVTYLPAQGIFAVGTESVTLRKQIREFSFLVDDTIFEVSAECGTITGVFEVRGTQTSLAVDDTCCEEICVYTIA